MSTSTTFPTRSCGAWLWDELKGWLLGLVFATVFVEIIYAIIRIAPQRWWMIAWAVFVGLFLLIMQLAPVVLFPLFYKFEPLNNDELRDRLTRLGQRAGTRVRGVYEWKLSEKSKKANAALMGIGATRRIILADTLLAELQRRRNRSRAGARTRTPCSPPYLVGHLDAGRHHLLRVLAHGPGLAFRARPRLVSVLETRLYDFANLPLIILVATVLGFLLMPALNALSRSHEREADLYAWENIPEIGPFVTAMTKLADQNLAERTPSRFVEWFFESHPSIQKRIAAAEAWARSRQPAT